ncbi:MAG: hypothetical protein LBJ08_01310, partial [Bifidobacteriaceae bacterium]|nr:hypothetical protein [Bifidobacteriaceae bacterium]
MGTPNERTARAAVETLRADLTRVAFILPSPASSTASERLRRLTERLDDSILPRLRPTLIPQIVALFGATGCGKSVIANTLSRSHAMDVGVLRPTTTRPVMAARQEEIDALAGHPVRALAAVECAPDCPEGRAVIEVPDVELSPPA